MLLDTEIHIHIAPKLNVPEFIFSCLPESYEINIATTKDTNLIYRLG